MKITIDAFDAFKYAEVWLITEMRDGCVFKTKNTHKYVLRDRPKADNEVYASLDTHRMPKSKDKNGFQQITFELTQ